jgi:ribosomal protein L37AE/L43A
MYDKLTLNLAEAGELLGLTLRQMRQLVRARSRQKHQIPVFKLGKRLVFRRESLEAWVCKLEDEGVAGNG